MTLYSLYLIMIRNILILALIVTVIITCIVKIQNTDLVSDIVKSQQISIESMFKDYLLVKFNDLILTKNE